MLFFAPRIQNQHLIRYEIKIKIKTIDSFMSRVKGSHLMKGRDFCMNLRVYFTKRSILRINHLFLFFE